MRRALVIVALVLAGLAVAAPGGAARPHVVLLVADGLGYADLGFRGSGAVTPTIDALAKDGVELTTVYAATGDARGRASLLTGRFPHRYRVGPKAGLDLGETTLARVLKDAGYSTFLVGGWGLGQAEPTQLPTARGYDHHYGPRGNEVDPSAHIDDDEVFDWWRDDARSFDEGYASTLLAGEAATIIRAHDPATPLFLHVSFTTPKSPLSAPPSLVRPHLNEASPDRRVYLGMVAALDQAVATVVGALDERGMRGDTLVLFLGDGAGKEGPGGALNDPLRGGAGGAEGVYEGGLRVPAIVSWPGRLAAGKRDAPVHLADVFPTVAALAKAKPGPKPLDGRDAWPLLTAGTAGPERLLPLSVSADRLVVREGRWKLLASRTEGTAELYDLQADPGEVTDVAVREPDVVARLRKRGEALAAESPATPDVERE
jgi:arylsulfatase A-like enzyme